MIDHTKIPETSLMDICAALDGPLLRFYADPENMKAYEKWAEERRKKAQRKEKTNGKTEKDHSCRA